MGRGGKRFWEPCPGTGMEAKWKEHPVASLIEIPECPLCGLDGFKTTPGGFVPQHREKELHVKRDYQAEYQRRKDLGTVQRGKT